LKFHKTAKWMFGKAWTKQAEIWKSSANGLGGGGQRRKGFGDRVRLSRAGSPGCGWHHAVHLELRELPRATACARPRANSRRRVGGRTEEGIALRRDWKFSARQRLENSLMGKSPQAARQSFEPTRFGHRIAAPDGSRQNEVAGKWRRNGLIRLNPRREMVWSRKPRPTRSGTRARGSRARLRLTFRGPAERLARKARRAVGAGCRLGSCVDEGRRRTRS